MTTSKKAKLGIVVDSVFKVLVTANLVALNYVFFTAYDSLRGAMNLFKGELALDMEKRLTEEFKYITKDMAAMKDGLLKSQEKLIPTPAKVETGLPIFK